MLNYRARRNLIHVQLNKVVMAKTKFRGDRQVQIKIGIFFLSGEKTQHSVEGEITLDKEMLTYEDLLVYCKEFLAEYDIRCETEIFTIASDGSINVVKIEQGYQISVWEVKQKYEPFVIIIKSALEQCRKQLEGEIHKLKEQISTLKQTMNELKPVKENLELLKRNSAAPSQLRHAASFVEKDFFEDDIDIGFLFSEPLFDKEEGKRTPPAVNFRSEISRLEQVFHSCFKPTINFKFDIATTESLKATIRLSKPKILHIACHGNKQGFLSIQDVSKAELGVQYLLKPDAMKSLLEKQKLIYLPELVFVNCCYSEKIGRAFFDLGVNYVVMINSADPISDEAAQIFSETFYSNIFKGESVVEAFNTAQTKVEETHSTGCCCHHGSYQPHREDCLYLKILRKNIQAHKDYHVPSDQCKCKKKKFNLHATNCEWAKKTLFTINPDFRFYDEEEKISRYQKPKYVGNQELIICCCPPEDKKPHSQSNKFKLLKKEHISQSGIFDISTHHLSSEVQNLTAPELQESHCKSPFVYGREDELYRFINKIREDHTRMISVYGKSGMGITSFTTKAATYMMERMIFKYFFFIDLYEIKDPIIFGFKFNEITKFDFKNKVVGQSSIKDQRILLLFDNCDDFLLHSPKELDQVLMNLKRELPKAKIIIVFKENNMIPFENSKIYCQKFELGPLDPRYATNLLNRKMKDKTEISVGIQEFQTLIKKNQILRSPKMIQSLVKSFPDSNRKVTLLQIEDKLKNINRGNTNQLLKNVLQNIKTEKEETYEFLIFCSQFSEGITYEHLNLFSSYDNTIGMNLKLPIRKNWTEHYQYLFEKEVNQLQQKNITMPKFDNFINTDLEFSDFADPEVMCMDSSETKVDTIANSKSMVNDSYFLDKIQKDRFIVKRFIRDFVWNIDQSQTTQRMKFLYVAYFSVILQMLFDSLRRKNYFHEELTTYSAISKAGIFSFDTSLQNTYRSNPTRQMTQSYRLAQDVLQDIEQIFTNNEALIKKLQTTDPSLFIMGHRHDFLRIYDTNWTEVYKFLKSRQESEQKIFLCMLENLFVYIPTALKIARAEEDLVLYVIKRSRAELNKLKSFSKLERSLILQLKISLLEIGISLQSNKVQNFLDESEKLITDYKRYLQYSQQEETSYSQDEINKISEIFKVEKKNIEYLTLIEKPQKDMYEKVKNAIEELPKNKKNRQDQLLHAKQALLIGMMYLKWLEKKEWQWIFTKTVTKSIEMKIQDICMQASQIFYEQDCKKLQILSLLVGIQMFWECEIMRDTQKAKAASIYEMVDKRRKQLIECEALFFESENKLGGFTKINEQIKDLKTKIKDWMWKSSSNRFIFMKAYPIMANGLPVYRNLVRMKSNFRESIRETLNRKVKILRKRSNDHLVIKKYRSEREEQGIEETLEVSVKFQIFTRAKIEEESEVGCSVMFISADTKQQNGRVYFVSEGEQMEQNLIQIDREFSQLFSEKISIIVISGANAILALRKIKELNCRCPIIIALNSLHEEDLDDASIEDEFDAQSIKPLIIEKSEIRKDELSYIKNFAQKIFQVNLESSDSNKNIRIIHDEIMKKIKLENYAMGGKKIKIKGEIHAEGCPRIQMEYKKQGIYRDLSPGYEVYHNLKIDKFNLQILLRRWKKMYEVLGLLRAVTPNKKLLNSKVEQKQPHQSYEKAAMINIYGETGSGRTYFVKEVAKTLLEREVYRFGVFYFEGKEIEKNYNGDIEAYIEKQYNQGKMPALEDLERMMGFGMLLIIDDFHIIKPKADARLKIFMEKVFSRKTHLILVSSSQLKMEMLPKMKKVTLEKLNRFEIDILAYSILNQNQIQQYQNAKRNGNQMLTVKDIMQIGGSSREIPSPRRRS